MHESGPHHRESSSLRRRNEIDAICDDFEYQCRTGAVPGIATFLERCDPTAHRELFEQLLLVDNEYRRKSSKAWSWEDYHRQFPGFSDQIESVRLKFNSQLDTVGDSTRLTCSRFVKGARIGHFELVKRLGGGGVGEVWQARDTRLQRNVALKFPRSSELSEGELHRFLREGKSAARLRHPHIVPVYEVDRDGDALFIVSEFVDGEDLKSRLSRGTMGTRIAARICCDLADALQAAHREGIIHRDLKPANILLDRNGEARLVDFGLAKWIDDNGDVTVTGELVGTPAYMSPEQACGEAEQIDARSDVYGLGIVLFEMITGQRPFKGDRASIVCQILSEEPPPPRRIDPSIPLGLEDICRKAISKAPQERYQTARELSEDLRRFLNDEPVLASQWSRWRRIRRWAKDHRAALIATVLAMMSLLSLGTAAMFAQRSHELLGLRKVSLTTEPPGARLTLVPLDEFSGEPLATEIQQPAAISPTSLEIPPGDYLVIAVLEDGRFHEVFRHVPKKGKSYPGVYKHNRWKLESGVVVLPAIVIPEESIVENMAKIDGMAFETASDLHEVANDSTFGHVAPFYLDTREFSIEQCNHALSNVPLDPHRWKERRQLAAATVSYDEAVSIAETIGKRLPTQSEYEFATTAGGRFRFPWGDEFPIVTDTPADFGEVGKSSFDYLAITPRVYGLCSNVAEWTTTKPQTLRHEAAGFAIGNGNLEDYRVAKGGDQRIIDGDSQETAAHRDPRISVGVSRYAVHPGLGFRCARSVSPRQTAGDFDHPHHPNPSARITDTALSDSIDNLRQDLTRTRQQNQ